MRRLNRITILSLVALIFSPHAAAQTGFYVEVGASYHDERAAYPEVRMHAPLASFELGYSDENSWSVGFRHTSSVPQIEEGEGINELFISKRIWIK